MYNEIENLSQTAFDNNYTDLLEIIEVNEQRTDDEIHLLNLSTLIEKLDVYYIEITQIEDVFTKMGLQDKFSDRVYALQDKIEELNLDSNVDQDSKLEEKIDYLTILVGASCKDIIRVKLEIQEREAQERKEKQQKEYLENKRKLAEDRREIERINKEKREFLVKQKEEEEAKNRALIEQEDREQELFEVQRELKDKIKLLKDKAKELNRESAKKSAEFYSRINLETKELSEKMRGRFNDK